MTPDGVKTLAAPGTKKKICTFLWVYYGYPSSTYEGVNVEAMRYRCGQLLARRDDAKPDTVAGVPDSGTATPWGTPMNRASRFPVRLSNTPPRGPARLCLLTRAAGI